MNTKNFFKNESHFENSLSILKSSSHKSAFTNRKNEKADGEFGIEMVSTDSVSAVTKENIHIHIKACCCCVSISTGAAGLKEK